MKRIIIINLTFNNEISNKWEKEKDKIKEIDLNYFNRKILIKKLNFYIFHIYFEKMFLVKIKRLDNWNL